MRTLVIGADHNALVCALKLATAGHDVTVLEGEKMAGIASVLPASPLAPEVAELFNLGVSLEIVGRVGVSSYGKQVRLSLRELSGDVSEKDQGRWPNFKRVMNNASELWRGLFEKANPDVVKRWREFGSRQSMEVLRLPCQSLSELLDEWFETDILKAALAVAGLRGSRQGPFAPGTAFLLLQRWARGEVFGRACTGGLVLKKLAQKRGVTFRKGFLKRFQLSTGRVSKALLYSGEELEAEMFVSNEDPVCTVLERIGAGSLDPEMVARAESWDCRSTTTVAKLSPIETWNGALVSFADSLEALERAYDPTKYEKFSAKPFAEFDSRSGWLYLQHTGGAETEIRAKEFCQRYSLGQLKRLYPPLTLEEQFSMTGGAPVRWRALPLAESDSA
jgi:phytoene dehydrogenase-like protein